MLTFLRKIRKSLIETGSARRYILYAIGEILLVMVGILLALQVNNWNEQRKTRMLEKKLILEYQQELGYNFDKLTLRIQGMQGRANQCSILLEAIDQKLPYADSFSRLFRVLSVGIGNDLSHVAFQSIEARGIDIISNDLLMKSIANLHANFYNKLERRTQNALSNIKEYARPIVRNRLKFVGNQRYVPVDYDQLMGDIAVWNILSTLKNNFENLVELMSETQDEIRKIDQLIDDELN